MDTYPLAFLSISATNILWFSVIVVLVIFSAFFSMSETAFSSVQDTKIRLAIENKVKGAKSAMFCYERYEKVLVTLLVGNNLVNTALSAIATMLFLNLGMNEDYVTLFSTLIITLVLLVFGEIMPKMIGKNHSLGIACKTAIIIKVIMYALYPFVLFFYGLQKIFSRNKQEEIQEKEELDVIVDKFEDEGSIESNEADVIHKVLDLGETTVKDIMVPRIKMSAINIDSTLDEVKSFMLDNNFSRIPVYKNDKDHIIGLLFERDFFPAYIKNNKVSWKKLIKPVKYVAATMKADDLIKEMQKSKIHLAIVSGEYGEVIGIVTMEDALEELVGEIYDEHDEDDSPLRFEKLEDGSYIVDADMFVDDMFEKLGIGDIPDDVPSKVSGWLFENCESLPTKGFKINYLARYTKEDEDGTFVDYNKMLEIEIYEVINRAITLARVVVRDATDEELEEDENLE